MIEEWKPINGYESLFEVSNYGKVRSIERKITPIGKSAYILNGKSLNSHFDTKGYLRIRLWDGENNTFRTHKIHRLVAQHFVENPDNKPMVNHKDGCRTNNYFENLEWCTNSENIQHAYDTGLIKGRRKSRQYYNNLNNLTHADTPKYSYVCPNT